MATKTFEGKSTKSLEDAIKNAIDQDPKGDGQTDMFYYKVVDFRCEFGGFVLSTTYIVKLERTKK